MSKVKQSPKDNARNTQKSENRRVLKGKLVNLVKLNCLEIYILEIYR